MAPHPFSLVCFRLRAGDAATEALLARVNATGRVYLTHTRVRGDYTIRLAVGAPRTGPEHVDEAWRLVDEAAASILASGPADREDGRTPTQ